MSASRRPRVGLLLVMGAVLLAALSASSSLAVAAVRPAAKPSQLGQWTLVAHNVPIRTPIHAAMLRTGKVLLAAGSGNDRTHAANHVYQTVLWDPSSGAYTNINTPWDVFCSGQSQLPDGGVLFAGGTLAYSQGSVNSRAVDSAYEFDPDPAEYVRVQDMRAGRWYPTLVTLGNGRVSRWPGLTTRARATRLCRSCSTRQRAPGRSFRMPASGRCIQRCSSPRSGKLLYTGGNVFGNRRSVARHLRRSDEPLEPARRLGARQRA